MVEDSPMQRELVAGLLRDEGYEVVEEADGKAGLEQASSRPPEVVFSDIQMPEMNGIEMCRELKKAAGPRNIPVAFLSALDNFEDVARGLQAGACDDLSKSADSDAEILAMAKMQVARLGRKPLYVNAAGRRVITGDESTAIEADRFSRFLSEVAGTCVDQPRGACAAQAAPAFR